MSKGSDTQAPLLSSKATSGDSSPKENKGGSKRKPVEFLDTGVWTTMRESGVSWAIPGYSAFTRGKDFVTVFPFVYRFFQECFGVGPWLVTTYFLASLWSSTESAVGLYFSSRLLDLMQRSILDQQVDRQALLKAVVFRIAFTLANSIVGKVRQKTKSILANRIRYQFEERLLQANLRLDLPTFEEPETASKISRFLPNQDRGGAFQIFDSLLNRVKVVTSVVSQISFLYGVLRTQPGSVWFAALCLSKSVVEYTAYESWWNTPSFTWASNEYYRRVSSLRKMATDADHRLEIVSNVLTRYIHREWNKAREFLRDVSDDHPTSVLRTQKNLLLVFLDAVGDDFPLIFYAYQVARSPGSFSLTSVALMQQASASLAWTISSIVAGQSNGEDRFSSIRSIYEVSHIQNNLQDGELHYPPVGQETSPGMEITFKNVSFAYPNAKNVIKDVSFTIRRGQTIIIVGVNGSGKSTLLKLFNRLYDPTSGTVLVDGVEMRSFRAEELRRASAMLFQKYSHFSLPIRENISMGLPDEDFSRKPGEKNDGSEDPVIVAARLGGAEDFIKAQSDGFDTTLKPFTSSWSTGGVRNLGGSFQEKIKEVTKSAEVSQGQWQRLALSRVFFRATGKDVKLVAVDEPSASLDPEMEYELFESLKSFSTKQGKTMVFVTHRFGHLTKQADLILVMENGCLVEQGKHAELLEMGGEYAKLYKLQADAFLPNEDLK